MLSFVHIEVSDGSRDHLSRQEISKHGTISAGEGMSWQHHRGGEQKVWSQEDGRCVPCALPLCVFCLLLVLFSMVKGIQLFTLDRS